MIWCQPRAHETEVHCIFSEIQKFLRVRKPNIHFYVCTLKDPNMYRHFCWVQATARFCHNSFVYSVGQAFKNFCFCHYLWTNVLVWNVCAFLWKANDYRRYNLEPGPITIDLKCSVSWTFNRGLGIKQILWVPVQEPPSHRWLWNFEPCYRTPVRHWHCEDLKILLIIRRFPFLISFMNYCIIFYICLVSIKKSRNANMLRTFCFYRLREPCP